jgi:bacterioferritin (cytochrome b1)
MLNNKETAEKLSSLMYLDFDAARAYEQAIQEIDDSIIRERMVEFLNDHERHVTDIRSRIGMLGETPPEPARDVKGFFLEGWTAIRSMSGTEGALKVMKSNEELTSRRYSEAKSWDVSTNVMDLIIQNFADEERHLAYIEEQLSVVAR